MGTTRFGVFRRFRSPAGAGVFPRGYPTRGARPVEVVPLAEALSRRWEDDRHIVLYTADKPYRINNAALGKVYVEVRLLALDVDNHDDAPGWMEGERVKIDALLAAHPGGFVHTTKRGWRALFALPRPFPLRSEDDKEAFALFYARVAAYLFEAFGVVADEAFTKWNQPLRLPNVVRDGRVLDAEILAGDVEALGAFELPDSVPSVPDLRALAAVLPRWGGVAKRWQPTREVLRVASAAFDHVPLPPYPDRVAAAERWAREEAPRAIQRQGGRATARSVAATLHVGFALERDDVARILTGTYNRRRCSPPWSDEEIEDLRGIAQAVAHTPIQVWGFMLSRDRTGIEVARATLAAAAESQHVVALEDVPSRLFALLGEHRALVLRATYGAGKTYGAAEYIATRTTGRVIVVVPTHELGRTWVEALASAGERDVAYHASVVKRVDDEGKPHCDQKVALRLYKEGGDVARDFCPTCPRAETCPAVNARPSAEARVHVSPREMIAKLGVTDEDLVVFDDSAIDLLEWHRLGARDLRRVSGADARLLPSIQGRYLRIFADALLVGPRDREEHARAALVAASLPLPPSGSALRTVAERLTEGQRSPHVPKDALEEDGDELTETLRDVGRLRRVLRFAAAFAGGANIRWSKDAWTVHGESAAATLLRGHAGRLVVLDAAANVEELRALRSDLHVECMDVVDAGDVRRVLLFAKHATRSALRDASQRRALLDLWLAAVLEELTSRGAKRPVLIAYKALVPELRAHPALAAWCAEDPTRTVKFAHYGALRGSNRFRRRDAVVTLGDPWLNGDDVTGRAEWLALDEPSYRIALATAELGQAHGRSRSVRRRDAITLLHVGRLVPDGWSAGAHVEPLGGPPERSRGAADRIEFGALVVALGGNRGAAVRLGYKPSALANWRSGRRGLPREALDRARDLVTDAVKPSVSSGEAGRGAPVLEMDTAAYREIISSRVHASASPAEEAVVAPLGDEITAASGFSVAALAPETNESSPSLRAAILDGESDVAGGLASERRRLSGSCSPVPSSHTAEGEVIGVGVSGGSLLAATPRDGEAGRVVRLRRVDREIAAMNAISGARVLAVLEAIDASSPSAPGASAQEVAGLRDEERALLMDAQASARLRYGLDAEALGSADAALRMTEDARFRRWGAPASRAVPGARTGPPGAAGDPGGGARHPRAGPEARICDDEDRAEVGRLGPRVPEHARAKSRGG
jgi:hypothetical protein